MTQVKYNGNRLIPAISLSYSRDFNEAPNGEILSAGYSITFSSQITADKGSPDKDGNFWTTSGYPADTPVGDTEKLGSILKKQEAILELFSKNNIGQKFELISSNGNAIYFFPNDYNVNFAESNWYNTCPYTITMTTDKIYPIDDGTTDNVTNVEESWTIQPQEQPEDLNTPFIYNLTHNVSAVGQLSYISGVKVDSYQNAKLWVESRLGIDNTIISGLRSGLTGYNHILTQNIDKINGSYSANENWILSSGNVIEDYNVTSQDNLNGLTNVTINGTINGLSERNNETVVSSKWANASGYFNSVLPILHSRAQTFSSVSLNPVALNYSIGRNPKQGSIGYNYQYDNRPSNFISGAKTERITVGYSLESSGVAQIPVLGRSGGPVLQSLNTSPNAKEKNLSIDFVLGPSVSPTFTASDYNFPYHLISGIVDALDPKNNGAVNSYPTAPRQNWEPITGIGNYTVSWIWE